MLSPACVRFRQLGVIALAVALLGFSGCQLQETTRGDLQVFTYPGWLSLVLFLAGGLVTAMGYFLLPSNEKPAYMMLLIGPIVAIFVAPSYWLNKTTVGPEELHSRSGTFGTTVRHVKYSELTEVKLTSTRSRRSTNFYLDCKTRDDREISLPLQVEGIKAAAPQFIQYLRAKRVAIVDHNGDPLIQEMGP